MGARAGGKDPRVRSIQRSVDGPQHVDKPTSARLRLRPWHNLPRTCSSNLTYLETDGRQALANDCPTAIFRGIDSHPKQVERYNEEAAKLFGEGQDRMYAIQGNLDDPSSDFSQADWSNFDVAVISMALHHVPHPVTMLSQLRERLRTGGCLVVVEWYETGGAPDATSGSDNLDRDDMIVVNGGEKIWAGFTPHGLSILLQQAGFTNVDVKKPDISFSVPESVGGPMSGQSRRLMFVKGVKSASSAL